MVPLRASDTLISRTEEVDTLVASQWPSLSGAALLAVGGYGRAELFPYSDVDLLILSRRKDLRYSLGRFLRTLWDAGLRVSHSVHTPEECAVVDDRNVELSVSLLDRRFLLGDRTLFADLRDPAREHLLSAVVRLTRERHARHGNTIYHLEPNIKEAPGGLRDVQVLRWLRRLEGVTGPSPEHDLLFRLRVLLHEFARRDQNILNFEMQDRCAPAFTFAGAAELMGAYYRQTAPLHRACLRRLDHVESRRSPLFAALRDRAARLSNPEFSVIHGHVLIRVTPLDSALLSRLFEFVARHGLPLAGDTEDRVRVITSATITWPELRSVMSLPHAAMAARAMHATGFFRALFPDLHGIESLVIHDYYHRYTVDEHTLVAIEAAAKLREAEGIFGELSRETADYPLLLLSLLFHDAGKGVPSGHHAEASVAIASQACREMDVSARETEIVLFLIGAHLEMSRLMLTRDLRDPGTAASLARSVRTLERLKLLTLLTYCDISAVNPEALTPWRTTLLWQLYLATARHLTRALQSETADEGMPARYALTHSADEIAMHHRMEKEGASTHVERVEGAYRLTVVAPDQPALLSRVAGALAGFGMNILRAESFTNERKTAVGTFCFADPMRTLELNPTERTHLEQIVSDSVAGTRRAENLTPARTGERRRPENAHAVQVAFDNGASPRATLLEISAEDRPGLLFDLTRSISNAGCNIEVVLVDTEGRKAIDIFYVTQGGERLSEEAARRLKRTLEAEAIFR